MASCPVTMSARGTTPPARLEKILVGLQGGGGMSRTVSPAPCREVFTEPPSHPAAAGADLSNSMDFTGKHIMVIGGSRGIGASCVEMLARRGADVGFTFVSNSSAAEALEKAVAAEGVGQAAGFKADVVSQAEMVRACDRHDWSLPTSTLSSTRPHCAPPQEAAMQASIVKFGRPLDGLICSAGVFEPTPIADWNVPYQGKTGSEAEFQRVVDINVMGTILAVKAALVTLC